MDQAQLHTFIAQKQPNICQAAAYRDGKLVYSDEGNGYKDTDCTHIMSATKSIMALLFGIAVDRGEIASIDEKVLTYFPDYHVKRGEKTIYDVTIRHLLTMRAPYKGKGDPWSKVCASPNWTYSSLDFLGGRGGITDEFNYRTVCLHILTGILYEATGMKTVDYANEYLFKPLGIGARNLQECFLIQARACDNFPKVALEIVENHFEDLMALRYTKIAKSMARSTEEVQKAITSLSKFSPHPGRQISNAPLQIKNADMSVVEKKGRFEVECTKAASRITKRLHVNKLYADMLNDKGLDKDTREYISNSKRKAEEFISAVNGRFSTMAVNSTVFPR